MGISSSRVGGWSPLGGGEVSKRVRRDTKVAYLAKHARCVGCGSRASRSTMSLASGAQNKRLPGRTDSHGPFFSTALPDRVSSTTHRQHLLHRPAPPNQPTPHSRAHHTTSPSSIHTHEHTQSQSSHQEDPALRAASETIPPLDPISRNSQQFPALRLLTAPPCIIPSFR